MTGPHHLLIMDDNADCAASVLQLLACREVAGAYGPHEAVLKAFAQPPGVVLMGPKPLMALLQGFDSAIADG